LRAPHGGNSIRMEPISEARYHDPARIGVEESWSSPQFSMAATAAIGTLLLMALFFFSTVHLLHGWWWGLFAVPAVLVGASTLQALQTLADSL
jgi:CHASE2 domain-containing sensor protein